VRHELAPGAWLDLTCADDHDIEIRRHSDFCVLRQPVRRASSANQDALTLLDRDDIRQSATKALWSEEGGPPGICKWVWVSDTGVVLEV